MNFLQTTKYQVKDPVLKQLIKYFWIIESKDPITVNHKLLPVGNIDFVLNFSAPIKYALAGKTETIPKGFHFSGLRNQYCMINQAGRFNIIGISFFSAGLYPFLKIPLSEFTNKTIELDLLLHEFTSGVEEKLSRADSIAEKLDAMEKELVKLIDFELIPNKEIYHIFSRFTRDANPINIFQFCEQYGINQRKLERIFNKYIGISPGAFQRLNRFQCVVKQVIERAYADLTSLAYDNGYYDQTHFIKDFKAYTGCSPSQFLNERRTVKEILKYN